MDELVDKLVFKPFVKNGIKYIFDETAYVNIGGLRKLSYTINNTQYPIEVTTILHNKKEMKTLAYEGDYIICGSNNQKYVISGEKISSLYSEYMHVDENDKCTGYIISKNEPRLIAEYTFDQDIEFEPFWGGKTILRKGDFIVKESKGKYYCVLRSVFHEMYTESKQ